MSTDRNGATMAKDHRKVSEQLTQEILLEDPNFLRQIVERVQTSPLSARHIAGVMLAEKSGVECARGPYLWDFTLVISPISRHPKSAYASQGLWRGLAGAPRN